MTTPDTAQQTSLLPPEVVEITVRIGLIGAVSHGQWQIEAHSATDGVLLAMKTNPHFDTDHRALAITEALTEAIALADRYLLPF